MRCRRKWLRFGLGILMVLLAGQTRSVKGYEYVETAFESLDEDASPEVQTSTKWEDATASPAADEERDTCSCSVHTYSGVWTNDSAAAYALATGAYRRYWTWNGPPGTTPPGGSLAWSMDAEGMANVLSDKDGSDPSTHGAASMWSIATAQHPDASSYLFATVDGSVNNGYAATGWPGSIVTPGADYYFQHFGAYAFGSFDKSIIWWIVDDGSDDIAAGTAQFNFLGGVECNSDSEASVAASTELHVWSQTQAYAQIRAPTTFTPNP